MSWSRLAVVLAMGLVMVVASGSAEADEGGKYSDRVSGTAVPTTLDFNGDGVLALAATFIGKSNRGPVHGGFVVDLNFPAAAPSPDCPAGTVKVPSVVSAGPRLFSDADDMLFAMDNVALTLACLNPGTGAFTMRTEGNFVGGAGKFAGATGTYKTDVTGKVLLSVPTNPTQLFAAFSLKTAGKVITPDD